MKGARNGIWRRIVAATVVATGLAVVWGLLCGWLASAAGALLRSDAQLREDILVAADGTPVVSVQSYALANQVTLSRRTIDGEVWPLEYEHWLTGAHLLRREQPPGLIQLPLPWSYGGRIGGGSDGRRPPTAWYVVRSEQPFGHYYLAGFDAFSKLPVGYIGRNGFRATPPGPDDQFAMPDVHQRHLSALVASTQYFSWWGVVIYHDLSQQVEPAPWLAFVLEANRLWEIDLRERSARVVLETPDLVSVAPLRALESTAQVLREPTAAARRQGTPLRLAAMNLRQDTLFYAAPLPGAGSTDNQPKYRGAIAVRTRQAILLYDAASGNRREFLLPKTVPNETLSAYWIAPEQLLLQIQQGYWNGGPIYRLMWIDPSGSIQRETEVRLAGYAPQSPRERAWHSSGIVPVPIVWLAGVTLGAPLYVLQSNYANDYTGALAMVSAIARPPLIVVLAIAAVLGWLTWRLHRKYRRPAAGAWTAFVLLLGLPGFLAYLLEHRRPKMERCRDCSEIVPRERDACANCGTRFPAPAPIGTEIFA